MKTLVFGPTVLVTVACLAVAAGAEPDFSSVPGIVITHQPARSGIYLGSPGLAILDNGANGAWLAKCDEFGPGSTEHTVGVSRVFRSLDRGATWEPAATVSPMYWASLFAQGDAVYLLGNARHNGDIVIMRSEDAGATWTTPRDSRSGLLFPGRFHGAPVPVVIHGGRLWRAMEDTGAGGGWGGHFRVRVLSVPLEADWLEAANWRLSEPLNPDLTWLEGRFRGWLEGNLVVDPAGALLNLLRVHDRPAGGKAAVVRVDPDGRQLHFNPDRDFIDLPGGAKKFQIRQDPRSRTYWALSNWVPPSQAHLAPADRIRNTLALLHSSDLRHWQVRCALLHHPDQAAHGFQYPDWLIDGEDLVAAIRTAHEDGLGGAPNQHDANFLTFHRWPNFRQLGPADSVIEVGNDETPRHLKRFNRMVRADAETSRGASPCPLP